MIIRAWVRIKGRRFLYVGEPDSGVLTTEEGYRNGGTPVGSVLYGVVVMGGEQVGYADELEWLPDPVPAACTSGPSGVRPQ